MSKHQEWFDQGHRNNWRMPDMGWSYRLPLIRHVRVIWDQIQIERWYSAVPGIRTGYDEWVLYGVWHRLPIHPSGGDRHGD